MIENLPGDGERREQQLLAAAILRREPHGEKLAELRGTVAGRKVLITGAGGHIGGGLARLVSSLGASHLALVDNGEHGLYSIDAELAERHPGLSRSAIYCDIRDRVAVERCMRDVEPDIVVHAAALKQLPLLERHAREAFLTNTIGAFNVATAAAASGATAAVLISTDKAARPSSVLGATKRLGERLFEELDRSGARTRFSSVRFGNVFGSRGSVVPLFRRQIAAGGPVTLTDPAMTRYFITLEEACRLVLSALRLTLDSGLRRGDLFVLEGSDPLSIRELAQRLIAHDAGEAEIPILTVGRRAGERVSESLIRIDERAIATPYPDIVRVQGSTVSSPLIGLAIRQMAELAASGDELQLCGTIAEHVPEFAAAPTEREPAVLRA